MFQLNKNRKLNDFCVLYVCVLFRVCVIVARAFPRNLRQDE